MAPKLYIDRTCSPHKIQRLLEVLAYSEPTNRWVKVYFDHVRFPNGFEGRYNRIIEGNGTPGVAILPLRNNTVGLVRQDRYPIEREVWEIPRGFGDSGDQFADARREIEEETGLVPCELIKLGVVHPNSGLLASAVNIFAALCTEDHLREVARSLDGEVIEFRWFAVSDVFDHIKGGYITDAFTIVAITHARLKGLV